MRQVIAGAVALVISCSVAQAAPIKLGETITVAQKYKTTGQFAFVPSAIRFSTYIGTSPAGSCADTLGCSRDWALDPAGSETGTVDFTSGTPGFDAFVASLTDGSDDTFYFRYGVRIKSPVGTEIFRGLGGRSVTEIGALGGPLLTGAKVDLIRLVVEKSTVEDLSDNQTNGYMLDFAYKLEFFQNDDPVSPVPLPASALLLLGGMALLGGAARRRR
ncbi:hypothetical protein [uncultured Roseobacter sp.]|uniref:hypothetical protein n=1 Tax=uncultured Roseobacter sp. TaxID=114847 RepID=UPI00260E599C|nr:hypothetical protein [uncultured Roseobacter sp.]